MELVIVQSKHQPLDDDGTIPSVHLHNLEHASISLAWLVFAAATIQMVRAPTRDGVSQQMAAINDRFNIEIERQRWPVQHRRGQ
jgi:hypothetical protein